jgi:hypothetical protein
VQERVQVRVQLRAWKSVNKVRNKALYITAPVRLYTRLLFRTSCGVTQALMQTL